ncbi:hypothetical protein MPL1_08990 [Methylophaga lonarensis MPL]|uniref:Protein-methionine-sulfoxide reductase heme-binding subunit MsrQ n=1 Tax=Methylophaga lonarensis MPL TaxID=1286106 RepID=M7NZM8_9GAMM|nr:protein-methionine-sulfoxide reductase heme-binding subunit MsrQ [Methylophaga lonarensis]EMR12686.1 hypothetical protein MPL1_08990 [Methylophaga lonarensis MPL]
MRLEYSKPLVFSLALLPFCWLVYGLLTDQLGANPIETLTRETGLWALRFLLITLCISPLCWLTGMNHWLRFRRMLGLFAFFYACLHMLLYLGLDQFFDVAEIIRDIKERPFITVGFINFLLLLPLALTSSNAMIKRLGGRRWRQLHRLSYLAAATACLHFLMLVKADTRQPIIYIALLAVLLVWRLIHHRRRQSASAS